MKTNTSLIDAIAGALVADHGEDATEWLEGGARANVHRIVAEWRAAIEDGGWIERLEDVLVLRALRHDEHWVEVLGGPDAEALNRELVDVDWRARGVETSTRIGEVFAHELIRGDTGEPFESIEYAFREHGDQVRGEYDEQPWNAAEPLSGAETRVEVYLAEARYVERRVPFVDLPGSVRRAKAAVHAGDESGWTPVAEGPVFRYVRALREAGEGCQRVLAIPSKRFTRKLVSFLSRPEVDALLAAPDRSTWSGRRDHAFILTAVQTGLRLSEMTGLKREDFVSGSGAHLRVVGKGRKERCTPLAKPTRAVLKSWLREPPRGVNDVLFPSARGERLTVHGVQYLLNKHRVTTSTRCPSLNHQRVTVHRLRHTAAMDLLQAGVDRAVIALWLGHESVETTQIYLEATLAMKEQALASTTPPTSKPGRYQPGDRLLGFLSSL